MHLRTLPRAGSVSRRLSRQPQSNSGNWPALRESFSVRGRVDDQARHVVIQNQGRVPEFVGTDVPNRRAVVAERADDGPIHGAKLFELVAGEGTRRELGALTLGPA